MNYRASFIQLYGTHENIRHEDLTYSVPKSEILMLGAKVASSRPYILIAIATVALGIFVSSVTHRTTNFSKLRVLFPTFKSYPIKATMSYGKELHIALLAVQRATLLTQRVFYETTKGTLSKDDKSPVTIGDFGAQALIISAIRKNFPSDAIVGEEEASSLRENSSLSRQIWELIRTTSLTDEAAERELGGPVASESDMLDAIDAGNSPGGAKGRIWALDPIDGTKGFLRGGQYAVCLALIEDGDVKVGVLGCPNLPIDNNAPLSAEVGRANDNSRGVLFAAAKGQSVTSRPLGSAGLTNGQAISMRPVEDITQATFCESVEAGHSSHGDQAEIAKRLGITKPSVRMDSQAKYGSIARGAGDLYLRLPVRKDYEEKIWDHAAGDLIVREAGGKVTDIHGKPLDFSQGRTLKENKGVVGAPAGIHDRVLKAVQAVLIST